MTAFSDLLARRIAVALIYVAAGITAGCYSAYLVIRSTGVNPAAASGPWMSRAAGLAGSSGYYVRAHYLLEGRLPPAAGQIVEATAGADGEGSPLAGACRYRIAASTALPRWWSLGVADAGELGGSLQATVDSDGIVKEPNGAISVVLSSTPEPGNWLRAPNARRFTLLYSATPSPGPKFASPPFTITREGCR